MYILLSQFDSEKKSFSWFSINEENLKISKIQKKLSLRWRGNGVKTRHSKSLIKRLKFIETNQNSKGSVRNLRDDRLESWTGRKRSF